MPAITSSSCSVNHSPTGTPALKSLVPMKISMASNSLPCSALSLSACRGMSFHCRPLTAYTYGVMPSHSCSRLQYFLFAALWLGSVMESPKYATRFPFHGWHPHEELAPVVDCVTNIPAEVFPGVSTPFSFACVVVTAVANNNAVRVEFSMFICFWIFVCPNQFGLRFGDISK